MHVGDRLVTGSRGNRRERLNDGHRLAITEDRISAIEVLRRNLRDVELAAVRIRTGVGVRERPRRVHEIGDLILEAIPGPTKPRAQRVPPLRHEIIDDAMEDKPIVEPPFHPCIRARIEPRPATTREPNKVRDSIRRLRNLERAGEAVSKLEPPSVQELARYGTSTIQRPDPGTAALKTVLLIVAALFMVAILLTILAS